MTVHVDLLPQSSLSEKHRELTSSALGYLSSGLLANYLTSISIDRESDGATVTLRMRCFAGPQTLRLLETVLMRAVVASGKNSRDIPDPSSSHS